MKTNVRVKCKMVNLAIKEFESGGGALFRKCFLTGKGEKEKTNLCLITDISEIVEEHIQIDPTFKTTRCYLKITIQSVKERLNEHKGYQAPFIRTVFWFLLE
jgi:hypothetical protein